MTLLRKILEALNYKHHPEIQTDSALVFRALKHHLSKPENYEKAKQHGHVAFHDLPVNDHLKKKYGPHLRSIHLHHDTESGNTTQHAAHHKVGTKNDSGGYDFHHEIHFKGIPHNSHDEFKKSIGKRFNSFYHEFTHLHDSIKGKKSGHDVTSHLRKVAALGDQKKTTAAYKKYVNDPREHHAHKNEIVRAVDHALINNPHTKKALAAAAPKGANDRHVDVAQALGHLRTMVNHPVDYHHHAAYVLSSPKHKSAINKALRSVFTRHGIQSESLTKETQVTKKVNENILATPLARAAYAVGLSLARSGAAGTILGTMARKAGEVLTPAKPQQSKSASNTAQSTGKMGNNNSGEMDNARGYSTGGGYGGSGEWQNEEYQGKPLRDILTRS